MDGSLQLELALFTSLLSFVSLSAQAAAINWVGAIDVITDVVTLDLNGATIKTDSTLQSPRYHGTLH